MYHTVSAERLPSVRICGLINSSGTPEEVACIANALVEEGFTAIKIKVARRADPVEDAAVIQEVRKKVGCHIELRVDANRNWTYEEAIQFGCLVKDCNLQYIEEPVQHEDDIIRYCEESGLPVALDETIDNCPENPLNKLVKYSHPRIVAVGSVIVFLHGFLGTNQDWDRIMHAISGSARCISVDLPGHGVTKMNLFDDKAAQQPTLSMELVADLLFKLIERITPGKVTLVGYSMGARIALYMALRFSDKIEGAVILSGSPGLEDAVERKICRAKDDSRACSLGTHGLQLFLDTWYSGGLWKSLRSHPYFNQIAARRSLHDDVQGLARVLSDLSAGRQPSLWEDLKHCRTPLVLVVGEEDEKFKGVAQKMWKEIGHVSKLHEMVVVPNCGHAVHLENPLPIIRLVRQFLTRLKSDPSSKK